MIYFKNTLSGKTEEFKPIDSQNVGMYNCGPTVYGKPHIGNLRAFIFADLIKNTLTYNGYKVHQVINITDVGHLISDSDDGADKIEEQAKKESLDAKTITEGYTKDFKKALVDLNIDISTIEFPKASEHIQEQIDLIKELEAKNFTYTTSDGVYFDTSKFPAYGQLGNIDIKGLQEGARVETNNEKRSPTDFALWKFSKEARQQEYPSPWGVGFPGWHIECSAMANKYLGNTFDIHTGGIDLIPTHHNNEIAQSVCAHDTPYVNYWLHVNHITIDNKKISKSIGNTLYLEDLKEKGVSPLAYKYWLYTSHYSTLSNFTFESVLAAQTAYIKLIRQSREVENPGSVSQTYKEKFTSFINNDLDTPKAIALMWDMLKDDTISNEDKKATLLDFDKVLKLDFGNSSINKTLEIPPSIIELAQRRKTARENKDFALADALREEIENSGFVVKDMDNKDGFVVESK